MPLWQRDTSGARSKINIANVAGVELVDGIPTPSTSLVVTIPQHFRNTWNVSVGADYFTDQITLKNGLGIDKSPANNRYRVQMPDNNDSLLPLAIIKQQKPSALIWVGSSIH